MNIKGQVSVFQTLIITMLVGGLAMASWVLFIGGFSSGYDVFSDNTTLNSLNQFEGINKTMSGVADLVTSQEEESFADERLGVIDEVFGAGFAAMKLLIGIPEYYYMAFQTAIVDVLGLPPMVVNVLFLIIVVIVLITIISAVTRI